MILISGSKLVIDSGKNTDLDVVYLTINPVRYILYVRLKKYIEKQLSKKFAIPVSFSPYLVLSPTIIGNMFIALTLLRYPYTKSSLLLKLSAAKKDRRWILLHLAFASLGLLTSKNSRDLMKYCSMIAENILYMEGYKIPNSWEKTIGLAYVVAKKTGLSVTKDFFARCLKCIAYMKRNHLNYRRLKMDILEVLARTFDEILVKLIKINCYDTELSKIRLDNLFRYLHQVIFRIIIKKNIQWVKCSSLFLLLIHPLIFRRLIADQEFLEMVENIYMVCKKEIPVLSPFAHP